MFLIGVVAVATRKKFSLIYLKHDILGDASKRRKIIWKGKQNQRRPLIV